MVAMVWIFTQVLKVLVLGRWAEGIQDKVTILTCYVAATLIVYMNYSELPLSELLKGGLAYCLMALGAHGGVTGISTKAKATLKTKWNRSERRDR